MLTKNEVTTSRMPSKKDTISLILKLPPLLFFIIISYSVPRFNNFDRTTFPVEKPACV